jgi:hypothetical protein
MKPNALLRAFAPFILGSVAIASGQEKRADLRTKDQEAIAQIQKLLFDTLIDIEGFPEELPLAKFLAALEAKFPKGKKVSLRIDEEAFGDQLPQVAGAMVRIRPMKDVGVVTVLRRALSQVEKIELDYGIRPTGVLITRPRLAAHLMIYDVRDEVRQIPHLLPILRKYSGDSYQDAKPNDGLALLVRFLMNEVKLRSWETIEVSNGVRIAVLASPTRQEDVSDALKLVGRFSDLAVVMNARIHEVDRAFFTRHVAPLFARDEDTKERPAVVRIDEALFKAVGKQKLILESEDIKLRPDEDAPFLSRQSAFRYIAGPHPRNEGQMLIGSGLSGVSFEVRPLLSPDLRYLRLRIRQEVAELIRIDKVKTLDVLSAKEVEVESPNLRKSSVTGTVQIPDRNPILMPVNYPPPGKESANKVWLLVARPFIWIEDEVKEIRSEGGDVSPHSVWDSAFPKEDKGEEVTPLPFNDKVKEVLQAIVTDVLTNPELKDERAYYGTAKDQTLILVDHGKLGWPKQFKPETHGFKLVEMNRDPFVEQRRVLGIRIDKFDLKQKKVSEFDTPIEICIVNAGGGANGDVIGGCRIYYVPKRVKGHWIVENRGLLDP